MKHPTQDKTKVSITEKAPDADQIVQQLIKDPARLRATVQQLIKHNARLIEVRPLIEKAKRRAEDSRREIKKVNENQREKTNRQKRNADNIIEDLIKKDPRLRQLGKQTKLAQSVR